MAHNCMLSAVRAARAVPVQLPLFLVPSFATNGARPTQCGQQHRDYANHAKLPKIIPKNKRDPLADPNASRKHLKADFPLTTRTSNRDMNRKRGVSAMRSTGPKQRLSIAKYPLPVPVTDPEKLKEKRNAPEFNDEKSLREHGLWEFFYQDKKAMVPPEKMGEHGREWTYTELTLKSFDDLHALYWVAHKERNRIATNWAERNRVHAGYGGSEDETRRNTVSTSQRYLQQSSLMNFTLSLADMIASGLLKPFGYEIALLESF